MVNIEELLKQVQQAETETERQWVLLELQMSQMPEALVSMIWASAIPHFFDEKVLAALCPELADEAEILFSDLQALTFVEEFPEHGYNVHELTREVLLSNLWKRDREGFLLLTKRAADYFSEEKTLSEEVEFAYHEILIEGSVQSGRLLDRAISWWNYHQTDRVLSVIRVILEHKDAERLDSFGRSFLLHLTGLTKELSANYEGAEEFFLKALEEYKSYKNQNPRYTAMLLRDLSSSRHKQGDIRGAISTCKQALKICRERLGDSHLDTMTSWNNLAGLYKSQGRYSEAEPLYLQSLNGCKSKLGNLHPNTAASLNNLASLYKSQGRYSEAEPLYLQSLNICKSELGNHHPHTSAGLDNLARLYEAQGRYSEAEPLYLQALEIRKAELDEFHPDVAISLRGLAGLYQKQKRYVEAITLLEVWKSVKVRRKETQNQFYALNIRKLGNLYEKCQQFPRALQAYEEALFVLSQELKSKHPAVRVFKGEIARLKKRMQKQSKRKTKP